jgi:hypothetical protein
MSRWFRFYDEAMNDPKVQRLPDELFKFWVNVLCMASKCNGRVPIKDVSFHLRMEERDVSFNVEFLKNRGLIVIKDDHISPHNWLKRQYKSDSSTDRVKRFRKRARNVTSTVTVTPPETETETEQSRKKEEARAPRGAPLPGHWNPSENDVQRGYALGFDYLQIMECVDEMREWAGANSNRSVGRKANWSLAFQAWMRRKSKEKSNGSAKPPNKFAAALARLGEHVDEIDRSEAGGTAPPRLLSHG